MTTVHRRTDIARRVRDLEKAKAKVPVSQGASSIITAATQALRPAGTWSSTVAYIAGDVVNYQGYGFAAKIANTNVAPTIGADTATWARVVDRGANGTAGAAGPAGPAATVTVGSTTTGAAGTNAAVSNSGTSSAATLNFTIPRGANGTNGANGTAATVQVGSVSTVTPPGPPTVNNRGTSSAAVLDFGIPIGGAIPTTTINPGSVVQRVDGALYLYNGDLYAYRGGAMIRLTYNDISGSEWKACTIGSAMRLYGGDPANAPRVRLLSPYVAQLYGRLQYGTGPTAMPVDPAPATLLARTPTGYRPARDLTLPVCTEFANVYTTTGKISIAMDGQMYFYAPSSLKAAWVSFDGIVFPLDQG